MPETQPSEEDLLNALETPAPTPPTPAPAPTPPPITKKPGEFSTWNWLEAVIDYNTAMIFGDTGSGKTKTCMQIAYECAQEGKKVKYIDHEANLSQTDIKTMRAAGITYELIPDYQELYRLKKEDLNNIDLMIIDSATLAITGKWSNFDMHQKGQILQMLQGMMYRLSQECIRSRKHIVIVTAQPISVMGERHSILPMGDKVSFLCKEIWLASAPRDEEGKVISRTLTAFRSRSFEDGTIITKVKTKKFGATLNKQIMSKLLEGI